MRNHPSDIHHIQQIGGFDSYQQAAAWTKANREVLNHIGTCPNDRGTGRSIDMFCSGWQPKRDNLRHERKATTFCCLYGDAVFRRGYYVGPFRPDVEMELNDHLYLIEIDCGTMPRPRVLKRWTRYRKFDADTGTVLVVAVSNPRRGIDSAERMQELIRWSESMYGIACFTTLEMLQADPYGPVLWDAEEGRYRSLKRPVETP